MTPTDGMAPDDMTYLGDSPLMVNSHDPTDCRGRGCWMHLASDWSLNSAPVDRDRADVPSRLCEHDRSAQRSR